MHRVTHATVTSVDTDSGTLVVKADKATRGGNALEGDDVTVKAVKGWVADTNDDGEHSIADVKSGDKTHPKTWDSAAFRNAFEDGARDGDCDHR